MKIVNDGNMQYKLTEDGVRVGYIAFSAVSLGWDVYIISVDGAMLNIGTSNTYEGACEKAQHGLAKKRTLRQWQVVLGTLPKPQKCSIGGKDA